MAVEHTRFTGGEPGARTPRAAVPRSAYDGVLVVLPPATPAEQPDPTRSPAASAALDPADPGTRGTASALTRGGTAVPDGLPALGVSTRRGRIALAGAAAVLAVIVGLAVVEAVPLWLYDGGPMIAAGGLAAVVGTYLCLALLVLVARVPWIEREVGHDRLVALHRAVAPYSLLLIAAHVVLTTIGYAEEADAGLLAQLWAIVAHSAWMLPAATAFVLMVSLGVLSYRRIRVRMRHETWWVAHAYFYLAVALAFGHQIELGSMFAGHPVHRWLWIGLYVFVAALVVGSRVVRPMAMSLRHDLRVASVVRESPDVVSVYLRGRHLDELSARGGQFFQWRFLTREWWWQAHPYSLSASPDPAWLRITVKDRGDQSGALGARLRPGTRVWAEGPYGVFTADRRHGSRVAAFAAGIGITAVRAMVQDLPADADVDIVLRARSREDAALHAEVETLAAARGYRVWHLEGSRSEAHAVLGLIPDLSDCDVYVCGPESFVEHVLDAAIAAGVPRARRHVELFTF